MHFSEFVWFALRGLTPYRRRPPRWLPREVVNSYAQNRYQDPGQPWRWAEREELLVDSTRREVQCVILGSNFTTRRTQWSRGASLRLADKSHWHTPKSNQRLPLPPRRALKLLQRLVSGTLLSCHQEHLTQRANQQQGREPGPSAPEAQVRKVCLGFPLPQTLLPLSSGFPAPP